MSFLPIGETLKQGSWRGPAKGVYLSLRVEKVLEKILSRLQSPEATADGGQAKLFPSTDVRPKMHSLREGKLTLLTASPTLSQEVYLYTEVLKRRINEALGGRAVEEVKLKIQSSKCKMTI